MEGNCSYVPFAFSSILSATLAALLPAIAQSAPPSCSTRMDRTEFSATFEWTELGKRAREMKIEVGSVQPFRNALPVTIARITHPASGRCHVVCRGKTFEKEDRFRPMALEMTCQSSEFESLTVAATLFWPAALGTPSPVLRFGTWVGGYRHAPLKVATDLYSVPDTGRQKKLAQF